MPVAEMLASGRFRGKARAKGLSASQTFDRHEDAFEWARRTETRMRSGKWQPPTIIAAGQTSDQVTVAKAFELYFTSEDYLQKAVNTQNTERTKSKATIAHFGTIALAALTADSVREFIAKRRKEAPARTGKADTMSSHAVRLEVAALSTLCNYAIERKWLEVNPCQGVKRPRGDRRTRRMTDEEIGTILGTMMDLGFEAVAFIFFRLLFTTVCRPGELASAEKTWLREDPPQIRLPRTKNEDERTILLTQANYKMVVAHLADQAADCPYIFGTPRRFVEGWSPYNYHHAWENAIEALGWQDKHLVPYLARHEGVSRLFERTNLSDGQIAGISGHRSAQALWHYKHLRNEHQRPIMNALDNMIEGAVMQALSGKDSESKLKPGEMMEPMPDKPKKGKSTS